MAGKSGTGKSVALPIVAERLAAVRQVVVGVLERPHSKRGDFYRELGGVFSVNAARGCYCCQECPRNMSSPRDCGYTGGIR